MEKNEKVEQVVCEHVEQEVRVKNLKVRTGIKAGQAGIDSDIDLNPDGGLKVIKHQ